MNMAEPFAGALCLSGAESFWTEENCWSSFIHPNGILDQQMLCGFRFVLSSMFKKVEQV